MSVSWHLSQQRTWQNFGKLQKLWCIWDHDSLVPHGGRQMILPTTRAWRNRFVALSLPRLRDCVICKITLRTFSRISKRDLQNTQTAPLAAVCTPTIKLVHRTTKDQKTSSVCEKLLLSLFFFFPPSLPDSLLSLSFCFWG